MKTGHFESGIAYEAAEAALMPMNRLHVSLQHSIATLAAKRWSARKIGRNWVSTMRRWAAICSR